MGQTALTVKNAVVENCWPIFL